MFLSSKIRVYITLIILFILNLLIKLTFSAEPSISNDEAFSIFYAQQPIESIIAVFKNDTNPPFYFLVLHYWIKLFGIDEFAVRSLSVFLGSLAGCLVFIIGKRFLSYNAGLLGALFFTFSISNIYYAQEVRAFSLILFLSGISVFSFLNLFFSNNKFIWAILKGLSSILLLWSHYLTIFQLIVELIFAFILLRKSLKGFWFYVFSQFGAFLLFLPWILVVLKNIPEKGVFWLQSPSLKGLFFGSFQLAGSRPGLFLLLIVTVAFILPKVRGKFYKDSSSCGIVPYFLMALWLVPVLMEFLTGQFIPIFLLRYFLYAGIGLFLFEAYLILSIRNKLVKVLAVLLSVSFVLIPFDFAPKKEENWREAAKFIEESKTDETALVISAGYKARDLFYYYDREVFKDYERFDAEVDTKLYKFNTVDDIDSSFKDRKKLIVVFSHSKLVDPEGTISNYLNEHFNYLTTKHFGHIKIHLYNKN